MDGVLIANECIDSVLKDGSNGFLCKLVLEKAYNRAKWGFLDCMLRRIGFGLEWGRWMERCYGSASFSGLFNGEPLNFLNFFKSSWGLCQGDPLSPLCS